MSDREVKLDNPYIEYIKKQKEEKEIIAQQLREQYPEIHRRLDEILKNAQTSSQ